MSLLLVVNSLENVHLFSWGPIPWLYPPEVSQDYFLLGLRKLTNQPKILPLSVRAKGVSLSTATNWAFNFLVGEVTPYLQEVITWRLYPMHGFFCVCSFILGKSQFPGVE